jgi:ApaG protein
MSEPGVYEARTRGVVVQVQPTYLADQSDPPKVWVWAYAVRIENTSEQTVQLVSRHWIITDGLGRVEEVAGPGVVGETPVLPPGAVHSYASGCPLPTSSGAMEGSYRMVVLGGGEAFDAVIPPFSLDLPDAARSVN